MSEIAIVILAAGKGTRMSLPFSKPLAPLQDKKLVDFPIKTLKAFTSKKKLDSNFSVVTGHDRENLESYLSSQYQGLHYSFQKDQNGTGGALSSYLDQCDWAESQKYTLIACADTPCLRVCDLERLYDVLVENDAQAVAASFHLDSPKGYGRIIRSKKGFQIKEEKDASDEEKAITEVNSGLYIVKTTYLLEQINKVDTNNAAGEFYLTDIFKEDADVKPVLFENPLSFLGVNTAEQLQSAEAILRQQKISELTQQGVRFIDPSSVYIEDDVKVGKGTSIAPHCHLKGNTVLGQNVNLEAGAWIKDSEVGDGAAILSYSHLESVVIKGAASIGPFARLRPGTLIEEDVKIGNFVETKKAHFHKGAKASHLSYVGDAEIGEESNLGCGFITCNYDGKNKHKTTIGKRTFIGSDTQVVAPVKVGDDCFIACGSTITQNMDSGSFAVSRGRQETKPGMAKRFLKK
jgi:bifunctional UDP-N-acetylglucosamine pyrophosphorylase/glucosamine-1-phosphate N-acetyltransferase